MEALVRELLERRAGPERARELAHLLATGVWTHDHPLMATELEQLGLPIRIAIPTENGC